MYVSEELFVHCRWIGETFVSFNGANIEKISFESEVYKEKSIFLWQNNENAFMPKVTTVHAIKHKDLEKIPLIWERK